VDVDVAAVLWMRACAVLFFPRRRTKQEVSLETETLTLVITASIHQQAVTF
jgi:hypothetical protein